MKIELSGTVRGETVRVWWQDGELAGSPELLSRLDPLVADGRVDRRDLTSVIRGIELVAGQRMKLRVIDERERRPSRAPAPAA